MDRSDRGDPSVHNRVTRAQPNDRYQGPILAGQRWKSRGTSNHQYLLYTVLRFNGRSVKAVVEGSRHHGGKVYNVPEASWRGNFNLVKQAPGYDPDAPLTMEVPLTAADTLEEAIDLEASLRGVREWHDAQAQGARTGPLWPANPYQEPDRLHAKTEVILAPPTRAGALELLAVVEQNVREERDKMPAQNQPEPPDPPSPPDPALPEPTEPAPETLPENPLRGWVEQGERLVQQLTAELASVDRKRTELRDQLGVLDLQYAGIAQQRDQTEQAVLGAIALMEGRPPAPPTEPAPESPKPPESGYGAMQEELERRREQLIRPRTPEGSRFAPAPGKVSQREWVLHQLIPGQQLRVAAIRDAFATEYGLTPDAATKNVSSLLGYQLKKRDPAYPAITRVESGVYLALSSRVTGV